MSLIYAKITGCQAFMLSDTKISDITNYEITSDEKRFGIIKSKIISSNLAIGFAGKLFYWEKFLKSLNSNSTLDSMINIAIALNYESDNCVAFLLLSRNDIGYSLIKIDDGKREFVKEAFIGDLEAVTQFRNYMSSSEIELENIFSDSGAVFIYSLPCPPSIEADEFSHAMNAMYLTINYGHFDDIGGFPVCLYYYDNKFKYFNYSIFCGNTINSTGNEFNNCENGSFSFHFLPISENVIAVYYVPKYLGIIYKSESKLYLSPNAYQAIPFLFEIVNTYKCPVIQNDFIDGFLFEAERYRESNPLKCLEYLCTLNSQLQTFGSPDQKAKYREYLQNNIYYLLAHIN